MYKPLKNVLFDPKKKNQPWRQYSPNGKRRKVINIPFNGKISNIRAQGTKVIGITPAAFSSAKYAHMSMYKFKPGAEFSGSKPKPFYMYTAEERARMTPEELRIAAHLQEKEDFEKNYRQNSARRSTIRLALDAFGETRGLSRELRGWTDIITGRKNLELRKRQQDIKETMLRNKGLIP